MKNQNAFLLGLLLSFSFVLTILYIRQHMFTRTGPIVLNAGEKKRLEIRD